MYWVFNDEQLENAFNKWISRDTKTHEVLVPASFIIDITEFLKSDEAKLLRGSK